MITIDMIFDATIEQIPIEFETNERELFKHQGYKAGSLMLSFNINDVAVSEFFYVIKDKNQTWMITFATSTSEFSERLPEFKSIFNSIEISED